MTEMLTLVFFCTWLAAFASISHQLAGVIYQSHPDFDCDLTSLKLEAYIRGGAGGVYVVHSRGLKYTLKFNRDLSHFQEEVIADKLYDILRVPTPRFIIVNNYSSFPQDIQDFLRFMPYIRIAEFISADQTGISDEERQEAMLKHFQGTLVIDAFMGNRDANKIGNNVFANGGKFYRIDNGGSLRNRSIGKKKGAKKSDHWDAYLIPELKSFVGYHPNLYESIDIEEIRNQAHDILSHASEIMRSLEEMATALSVDASSREELTAMLTHRLQLLQMILRPGTSFPSKQERPVTALTGAGTFLMCQVNNAPYVLLASRKSSHPDADGSWVTLGGKSDFGDDLTLAVTAHREILEESTGIINLEMNFDDAIFHDLTQENYLYRQYFVQTTTDCTSTEALKRAYTPDALQHNRHLGKSEYHEFRWFAVSDLRNISEAGVFGKAGERAFSPFNNLLHVPHVQWLLEQFVLGKDVVSHRQTQSMSKQEKEVPTYGEFLKLP